ncbi:CBF/Mak21 family-domain-containing protein [Coniochaeta sp. 2T2.1]|nr:CBF/Mak21 family-domain-containing protein [Coniochaeta sp. 2T2.1]
MAGKPTPTASKRKHTYGEQPSRKKKRPMSTDSDDDQSGSEPDKMADFDGSRESKVLDLEMGILESKKNYNNIATLIRLAGEGALQGRDTATLALVSLCRVFIRLLSTGSLTNKKNASDKEKTVVRWLRERMAEYRQILAGLVQDFDESDTAMKLSMKLLEAEARYLNGTGEYNFPGVSFSVLISALLRPEVEDSVRAEFIEQWVDVYDDIRYYTFRTLREILSESSAASLGEDTIINVFDFLTSIEGVPEAGKEMTYYIEPPEKKTHPLRTLSQHKKQAQEAWMALMRLGLNKPQKKKVLEIMATSIAPWFTKPELLMDFLTDCYNEGGSVSLLALSGVFFLIQERNLDYPLFYNKLYSLLDADLLHSKHRSRFFRLLDTFLASSHLPAVLVASFVKRLARLALNAPPSAIVAIVPWMYNILKKHPLCTFMIHRVSRTPEEKKQIEQEGLNDPFLPDEMDPMETKAIESCLWEIVQLQSHYHPNVATIAKIISEQFTKQVYNIEDFLDHSYQSLIEAEMHKEVKKPPVVEFMIPKRIFTSAEKGAEERNSLLVDLWDFSPQA